MDNHIEEARPMAKLIYAALASLDGYTVDEQGRFDWAAPDEEVHDFVNDLERPIGTHLYGRRMYETMRVWETWGTEGDEPPPIRDYAEIWRAANKVVFSSTLDSVDTARTRLERSFDAAAMRELVSGSERDVSIGGPTLAAHALRAGLVDECWLILNPVVVGAGTPALPPGWRAQLQLVDERRFGGGAVYLRYRVTG
jgi:dihydrofolate reductase